MKKLIKQQFYVLNFGERMKLKEWQNLVYTHKSSKYFEGFYKILLLVSLLFRRNFQRKQLFIPNFGKRIKFKK